MQYVVNFLGPNSPASNIVVFYLCELKLINFTVLGMFIGFSISGAISSLIANIRTTIHGHGDK